MVAQKGLADAWVAGAMVGTAVVHMAELRAAAVQVDLGVRGEAATPEGVMEVVEMPQTSMPTSPPR